MDRLGQTSLERDSELGSIGVRQLSMIKKIKKHAKSRFYGRIDRNTWWGDQAIAFVCFITSAIWLALVDHLGSIKPVLAVLFGLQFLISCYVNIASIVGRAHDFGISFKRALAGFVLVARLAKINNFGPVPGTIPDENLDGSALGTRDIGEQSLPFALEVTPQARATMRQSEMKSLAATSEIRFENTGPTMASVRKPKFGLIAAPRVLQGCRYIHSSGCERHLGLIAQRK